MKRNNIKQGFLSLAAACLAFTACTGDFERFNTDPNSAQEVDLKMFITTMQMDAVYSCSLVSGSVRRKERLRSGEKGRSRRT